MKINKKYFQNLLIVLIIAAGVLWRINAYGDLRLSLGMLDTQSIIDSSVSADGLETYFTGRRLPTMNLLYKLMDGTCDLTISDPYFGKEPERAIQPCFNTLILTQNVLSIFGWVFLAWMVGRRLEIFPVRIIAVAAILAFGFSPQIAEWDSILSSESPSLFLFAIMFALLIDLVFQAVAESSTPQKINLYIVLWLVFFTLWALVRDVHIYATLITLVLVLPFWFFPDIRKIKGIIVAAIFFIVLFAVTNHTSKLSPRWQPSLRHVLDYYVFPYPSRVDFFIEHGMPVDVNGNEYSEWFNEHGVKTYGLFLLSHPGFIVITVIETAEYFKSDFIQPYFVIEDSLGRRILTVVSEILHPETNFVYIVCLLLF